MLDTAKALRYLHAHNILHRELFPGSVYISAQTNKYGYGIVKLGGFGAAKSQDFSSGESFSFDKIERVAYSAPEILLCKDANVPFTVAGEMYSFGVFVLEVFLSSSYDVCNV
jgi:serine/threonine protein kinase